MSIVLRSGSLNKTVRAILEFAIEKKVGKKRIWIFPNELKLVYQKCPEHLNFLEPYLFPGGASEWLQFIQGKIIITDYFYSHLAESVTDTLLSGGNLSETVSYLFDAISQADYQVFHDTVSLLSGAGVSGTIGSLSVTFCGLPVWAGVLLAAALVCVVVATYCWARSARAESLDPSKDNQTMTSEFAKDLRNPDAITTDTSLNKNLQTFEELIGKYLVPRKAELKEQTENTQRIAHFARLIAQSCDFERWKLHGLRFLEEHIASVGPRDLGQPLYLFVHICEAILVVTAHRKEGLFFISTSWLGGFIMSSSDLPTDFLINEKWNKWADTAQAQAGPARFGCGGCIVPNAARPLELGDARALVTFNPTGSGEDSRVFAERVEKLQLVDEDGLDWDALYNSHRLIISQPSFNYSYSETRFKERFISTRSITLPRGVLRIYVHYEDHGSAQKLEHFIVTQLLEPHAQSDGGISRSGHAIGSKEFLSDQWVKDGVRVVPGRLYGHPTYYYHIYGQVKDCVIDKPITSKVPEYTLVHGSSAPKDCTDTYERVVSGYADYWVLVEGQPGAERRLALNQIEWLVGQYTARWRARAQADTETTITDKAQDEVGPVENAGPVGQEISVAALVSSLPPFTIAEFEDHWIPLPPFKWNASAAQNALVHSIVLPNDLYRPLYSTPVIVPFTTYVFSEPHVRIRFVTNGTRYMAGQLLAGVVYSPQHSPNIVNINQLMQTAHVIIQPNGDSITEMEVPFEFHRGLVRNFPVFQTNPSRPCIYARIVVLVYTGLNGGTGSPETIDVVPMVNLNGSRFYGPCRRVDVVCQMDEGLKVLSDMVPSQSMRDIVKGVRIIKRGMGFDKPQDPRAFMHVPVGVHGLASGKGVAPLESFKVNPASLLPQVDVKCPVTTLDIARLPGVLTQPRWEKSHSAGYVLEKFCVDPGYRGPKQPNVAGTPLEYVCNMYTYWAGDIVVEVEVHGTDLHQGTLLISMDYNHFLDCGAPPAQASGLRRFMDLKDGLRQTFTIPYLRPLVWTKTARAGYEAYNHVSSFKGKNFNLLALEDTRPACAISVAVPLVAPETVAQSVDVIVKWAAGDNFRVYGLAGWHSEGVFKKSWNRPDEKDLEVPENRERHLSGPRAMVWPSPVAQADSGLATPDNETNIKDILRIPCFFRTVLCEQGHIACLPLCVPSQNSELGQYSLFSAIMSCFRYWRGGLRFTIIARNTVTAPVYISVVGPGGLVREGSFPVEFDAVLPHRAGLRTIPLMTMVNPSIQIEVPYLGNNLWCTVAQIASNASSFTVDLTDDVMGHLLFTCAEKVSLDVWIAAADDFQWANYTGTRMVTLNAISRCPKLNAPYAQMDTGRRIARDLGEGVTGANLIRGALMATPLGVPALAVRALSTVDRADKTLDDMQVSMATVTKKAGEATDQVGALVSLLSTKIEEVFGQIASAVSYTRAVRDIILDVSVAIVEKSWYALSVGVVRLLTNVIGFDFQGCIQWVDQLRSWFSDHYGGIFAQADLSARLVAILAGLVGFILKVRVDTRGIKTLAETVTESGCVSYVLSIMRIVQYVFETLKELVVSALTSLSPETRSLRALCDNSAAINAFVTEAQICMSELNANVRTSPYYRTRFCLVVLQAYQIQKLMANAPANVAKPGLVRLCADVLKFAQEKSVDVSHCPERFEPYSIWITGQAGIGKSHLAGELVSELLDEVDVCVPPSGAVYTVQPGSKHWNGFKGQLAVVFDDFANVVSPDLLGPTISTFYQLKSSSHFIPEMAAVEDKQQRGNPLLLVALSNASFPHSIRNMVGDEDAFFRRRDIMIDTALVRPMTMEEIRNQSPEDSEARAHLRFRYHHNPRREAAGWANEWMSWAELKEDLRAKFHTYYDHERAQMQKRLERYMAAMHRVPLDQINIADPYSVFYSLNQQVIVEEGRNFLLPSEQLEIAARRLIEELKARPDVDIPIHLAGELPGTQADCNPVANLYKMVMAMAQAATFSVTTLDAVLGLSERAFHHIASYVPSPEGPAQDCVVCHTRKPCLYSCCNATDESPHATCEECFIQWRAQGRSACPMCRGEIRLAVSVQDLEWLAYLRWLIHRGAQSVETFISAYRLKTRTESHQKVLKAVRWFSAVTAMVMGQDPLVVVPATAVHLHMDHPDVFYDAIAPPTQSLWETVRRWTTLQAETRMTEQGVFEIHVDAEAMGAYVEGRPAPVCLHKLLVEQVETAHFEEDSEGPHWYVVPPGTDYNIKVMDGACSCEGCPFRDSEQVEGFYQQYLQRRASDIQAWLIGHHNQSSNTYFRRKIPVLLRPRWMDREPVHFQPTSWWEYLGDLFVKYKRIIAVLAGTTIAIGSVLGMYKLVSGLMGPARPMAQAYMSPDAGPLHGRIKGTRIVRDRNVRYQAEGEDAILQEKVYSNYVTIKAWRDGKVERKFTALGIFGHRAIIPYHYVPMMEKLYNQGYKLTIEPSTHDVCDRTHMQREYTWDSKDFTRCETTDFAVFLFPASYPLFKDIRKYFWTRADLSTPLPAEALLILAPTRFRRNITYKDVEVFGINPRLTMRVEEGVMQARDVVEYNHSEDGACGSVLMRESHTRPIMCMHIAGTASGSGFGVILTQELINEVLQEEPIAQMEQKDLTPISEETSAMLIDEETAIEYKGVVSPSETPFLPTKSKLTKSLIYGVEGLEAQLEPCILHKNDERYTHPHTPLWYGVKKHGLLTKDFPTSTILAVKEAFWDVYMAPLKPIVAQPRRLTMEEAIQGFDGVKYYDPMKLSTSAGYPWCLDAKRSAKSNWITVERNKCGKVVKTTIDPSIVQEIKRKEALRRTGVQPFTIFVDTLKDEKKRPEKVRAAGGTRVFCNAPVDYTISCRQNLLHWFAAAMHARFTYSSAVGINPHGKEWTDLFNLLAKHGLNNIIALDYSNFGPGFNARVAHAVAENVVRWVQERVTEVSEPEVWSIFYESINSVHLANNTVYQQHSGSASGSPMTSIINTDVNKMYIMAAWFSLVGDKAKGPLWREYRDNVTLVCYGDDLIMSVSDAYIDVFNGQTIAGFFAEYGIVATDSVKTGDVVRASSIWDVEFLKRKFVWHPTESTRLLAPLRWTSVSDATQWVWKSPNLKEATEVNCYSALLEAHSHGRNQFEQFKRQVNNALMKKKCKPVLLTWAEIDKLWIEDRLDVDKFDQFVYGDWTEI